MSAILTSPIPITLHYRRDRTLVVEINETPGERRFLLTEKAIKGEAWNRGLTRSQFLQLGTPVFHTT